MMLSSSFSHCSFVFRLCGFVWIILLYYSLVRYFAWIAVQKKTRKYFYYYPYLGHHSHLILILIHTLIFHLLPAVTISFFLMNIWGTTPTTHHFVYLSNHLNIKGFSHRYDWLHLLLESSISKIYCRISTIASTFRLTLTRLKLMTLYLNNLFLNNSMGFGVSSIITIPLIICKNNSVVCVIAHGSNQP